MTVKLFQKAIAGKIRLFFFESMEMSKLPKRCAVAVEGNYRWITTGDHELFPERLQQKKFDITGGDVELLEGRYPLSSIKPARQRPWLNNQINSETTQQEEIQMFFEQHEVKTTSETLIDAIEERTRQEITSVT